MEKDYDCKILYHPRKVNVVADALSRKSASTPIKDLFLRMVIVSPLFDMIKEAQVEGLKKGKREGGKDQGLDSAICQGQLRFINLVW